MNEMLFYIGVSKTCYIQKDFTVKEAKHFEFALYICMRAVAEFVCEVAHGQAQVGFDQPSQFLAITEHNIDAAYCTHFLCDYAFMFHQMRRSVRVGDHATIDLVWREAFTTFHTKVPHHIAACAIIIF